MVRSKNPDLIFDEVLEERAERVSRQYFEEPEFIDLDRVTLFVTHKCNLKCKYCNGPHLSKDPEARKLLKRDITLEQYRNMIDDWALNGLKNIHFTGGEATMNLHLHEFIELATYKGISSTLTTNGMANNQFYKKLIDNGLNEIRISIDTAIDEEFDELVGVKGACQRVKGNIDYLANLRDKQGKDIFIILNACIGTFNIDKIKTTLDSLIELRPDDVKFLVVAEEGEQVHSKASRKLVDELVAYAKGKAPDYELLEKKIRGMFRKYSFGLKGQASKHIMQQCFIPLTERTLDAEGIYPCSIYLRYRGEPLASVNASFEEQQKAINEFVENHDCREDEICIDNCTNCCKMYNIEVNKKIRKQEEAKNMVKINIGNITQDEIKRFETMYKVINKIRSRDFPFIIIKPHGVKHQDEIIKYLQNQGIIIADIASIKRWNELSLFLYYKPGRDVEHRLARNKAYSEIEHPNRAIFLMTEKEVPEKKLSRIKRELREWYGEKVGKFYYKGEEHFFRSNCIHSPDYKDLARESKVIKFFLSND